MPFQSKVKRLPLGLFILAAAVLLVTGRIAGEEIRKHGETGGPSGAPIPLTAGALRVSVDGPSWAPAGYAIQLMLRIEDSNGALVKDPGLRVTLLLGGSATFGSSTARGILVQGAATNRTLVEFAEGRVTVEVSDPVSESIRLEMEDSELLGAVFDGGALAAEASAMAGAPSQDGRAIEFLDPGGDEDSDGLADRREFWSGTDPYAADTDADGYDDGSDNCPSVSNPEQTDSNGDGYGDVCSASAAAISTLAVLPFRATDAAFDPIRPYMYVTDKAGKKVVFVNLATGSIDRQFSFDLMPESLALTPDGSRLFVALLTREHSYSWVSGRESYIASFDLAMQVEDRQVRITEDPADLVATSDGYLIVSPGSGYWTPMHTFDATTGTVAGTTTFSVFQGARLALHPSQMFVYGADTGSDPSDIFRLDLQPGGVITYRWDSTYHGEHRMNGNVWPSPRGDVLITRGGDIFSAGGDSRSSDMIFQQSLSAGNIESLAFDATHRAVFTGEGSALRYYNLSNWLEIGSQVLGAQVRFVGLQNDRVYALTSTDGTTTTVVALQNPALGGATNTAPIALFTVTPATGGTTQGDFRFDASGSSDAEDAPGVLRFRWDFDNDGMWDTEFSNDPVVSRRFPTAGTKFVRLQVMDSLALINSITVSFNVAFEPDPGQPEPQPFAFDIPFPVTDAVFDPHRPYLYVTDKAGKTLSFIDLTTGFIAKQFPFDYLPESLALTPEGSRLFVSLLSQDHSQYPYYSAPDGFIASFGLETQEKDRQFAVAIEPRDVLATSDGHLVIAPWNISGSVRTFDATTGALTGSTINLYPYASLNLTLHPSEHFIYGADHGIGPDDMHRLDLQPGGAITYRWDSPYHGDRTINGNVWTSPHGDILLTAGGDIFSAGGSSHSTDMVFLQSLSAGSIESAAFDATRQVIFTAEGSTLRYYNLSSWLEIGRQQLAGPVHFVGLRDAEVYALLSTVGATTTVTVLPHPALGGSTNTPPVARFTMTPAADGTTLSDFRFDASVSTDAEDSPSALRFRWDFDNDGQWDTDSSNDPVIIRRFATAGTKFVRLQVLDTLALADSTTTSFNVALEPGPGQPGQSRTAFEIPFPVTDAVFDPRRSYLYVTDKPGKMVLFVNTTTGFIEKQFSFDLLPESLSLTPDGSRLFVSLLVRDHISYPQVDGFIASFNLDTKEKDRQFAVAIEPRDLVATSDGHLVIAPWYEGGSIRTFDATTGALTGSTVNLYPHSALNLALHPSERIVYGADHGVSPDDMFRMDLQAGGAITYRWDSPYHGEHPIYGDVWASPRGDVLLTRAGEVFTAGGTTYGSDLTFVRRLTVGQVADVVWDVERDLIVTLESSTIRRYRLTTYAPIDAIPLAASGSFMGRQGSSLFVVAVGQTRALVLSTGVLNRPPVAQAGPDMTLECSGNLGATVALDASGSSDPDSAPGSSDDIARLDWYETLEDGSVLPLGTGRHVDAFLSLGSHRVGLRVTDTWGRTDQDETMVIVRDSVPPTITGRSDPALLWPPNHRMVRVHLSVAVIDACDPSPGVALVQAASSDPDDEQGGDDGATVNDIEGAAIGTADFDLALRSERAGTGGGRTYTLGYRAMDAAGNTEFAEVPVVVPHDQGGANDPIDLVVHDADGSALVQWDAVPGALFYNVIRGEIGNLRDEGGSILLGQVACLADATTGTEISDGSPGPPPGAAYFYLVEYNDGRRISYGTASALKEYQVPSGDCR